MSQNQNILKEVKPKLLALVDELVARGAERSAVIYMIEQESAQLRDGLDNRSDHQVEEPSNDWPAAGRSQ
ncbi:hypothetical protein [Neorhizobium sp. NCHU2750]|uniref:hypothetical protein n=1 Tax=Neorhizobium sp. NCHU2750 TaxID=1825976 RepID=UPI000EB67FC4|nr:hypothetical protein NCHU2750_53320 [Neorhizobium sp. NCHU2750]